MALVQMFFVLPSAALYLQPAALRSTAWSRTSTPTCKFMHRFGSTGGESKNDGSDFMPVETLRERLRWLPPGSPERAALLGQLARGRVNEIA